MLILHFNFFGKHVAPPVHPNTPTTAKKRPLLFDLVSDMSAADSGVVFLMVEVKKLFLTLPTCQRLSILAPYLRRFHHLPYII
jgi:hypothetical protein